MALQSTTAIATITLQQASSTVTFSGIPNTYRDLILVADGTSSSATQVILRFNGATSGYSEVAILGYASGAISYTVAVTYISQMIFNTTRTNNLVQIMDYSATDKHKTALIRADVGGSSTLADAGRWANLDAIHTITMSPESGGVTFTAGTTFSLYGRIA